MNISSFQRSAWIAQCERLAAQAASQSELSYARYVVRFSVLVDQALQGVASESHEQAIELAERWGYAGLQERTTQPQGASDDAQDPPCGLSLD